MVIVAAALALPLASIALEQATRAFPDSGFATAYLAFLRVPRNAVTGFDGARFFGDVLLSPLMAGLFNWPFIVFAVRIKGHIRRYWPHAVRARAAMIGASLAGLIPYVFFYVLLPADSLAHAGAGVSLLVPFLWLVGSLSALAGTWVVDFFAD